MSIMDFFLGPKCPRCGSRDLYLAQTSPVVRYGCRKCQQANSEQQALMHRVAVLEKQLAERTSKPVEGVDE